MSVASMSANGARGVDYFPRARSGFKISWSMYSIFGFLGLLVVLAGIGFSTLAGRHVGARLLRVPGLGMFGRSRSDDYFTAPPAPRYLARLCGPLGAYAFASLLFLASLVLGGRSLPTLIVDVATDGPAARAGVLGGDRIVSVDKAKVITWDAMREAIKKHPSGSVPLGIERGSARLELLVEPKDARIGVSPRYETEKVPLLEALIESASRPFGVWRAVGSGIFDSVFGSTKVEVVGTVGISKEVARSARRGIAEYLSLLGILAAYWWPGALIVELLTSPRRRSPTIRLQ